EVDDAVVRQACHPGLLLRQGAYLRQIRGVDERHAVVSRGATLLPPDVALADLIAKRRSYQARQRQEPRITPARQWHGRGHGVLAVLWASGILWTCGRTN